MTTPNQEKPAPIPVKVVDVDISMGQMIVLLVKFTMAAIPAAILVALILLVISAIVGGAGFFAQLLR